MLPNALKNFAFVMMAMLVLEDLFAAPLVFQGQEIVDPFRSDDWLTPNEVYPNEKLPALETIDSGTLISVGSDRGFITAAILPQITDLVLVDRSDPIVYMNKINICVLKLATDRRHYLELRTKDITWDDWKKLISETTHLSEEERQFMMEQKFVSRFSDAYRFWTDFVVDGAFDMD